jgi:hypothetical protein
VGVQVREEGKRQEGKQFFFWWLVCRSSLSAQAKWLDPMMIGRTKKTFVRFGFGLRRGSAV